MVIIRNGDESASILALVVQLVKRRENPRQGARSDSLVTLSSLASSHVLEVKTHGTAEAERGGSPVKAGGHPQGLISDANAGNWSFATGRNPRIIRPTLHKRAPARSEP